METRKEKQPLILLYGETDGLLNILTEVFRQKGYDVCSATDYEKALVLLDTRSPDVLVLDIGEFNDNVLRNIDAIRSQSDIPIIILSTQATTTIQQSVLSRGVNGFVAKPFRLNELMARVEAKLKQNHVN